MSYTLEAGTTYILGVSGSVIVAGEIDTGPYTVRAVALDEPGIDAASAPEVTLGIPARGNICPTGGSAGDKDYFKLVLASAADVLIAAVGDPQGDVDLDTHVTPSTRPKTC